MRALKAAAAFVVLGVLLAAPPGLLVHFIGNPWPPEGVALDAPLTDDAVIGLLAALLWFLWAQFAICVLAELAAALTDDRVGSHVPVAFGFQRLLARRLVSVIVIATVAAPLLASSGGAAAAHHATGVQPEIDASAATSAAPGPIAPGPTAPGPLQGRGPDLGSTSPAVRAATSNGVQAERRRVTVMRLDTLWSIAERELGEGERWTEIAHLNEGHVMSDGSRFVSADHIRPGWQLVLPGTSSITPSRERDVEVVRGDSLSSIAQRELGGADQWQRVYNLNRTTIGSDADLIRPGQILQLPTPTRVDQDEPPAQVPATTEPTSHGDDQRNPGPPPRSTEPPTPISAEGRPPHRAEEQETTSEDITLLRALLATAVCLASGAFVLLVANRRRQFRNRRPGRTISEVPTDLRRTERVVQEAGTQGENSARFIDTALRHLATQVRETGASLPKLGAAVLDKDRLTLLFSEPAATNAPAPWSQSPDRQVWSLPRTAALGDLVLEQPAPYPALVTFAEDPAGRTWLLDLESVGAVSVAGDITRVEDLIRFLVAELAVNAWAEGVEVLLTEELSAELVDLNPTRVRRGDPHTAQRRAMSRAQAEGDAADLLLDRRRDDTATDSSSPLVVVCGSRPATSDWTAAMPRSGVVTIWAHEQDSTDDHEPATLTLEPDGHVRLHGIPVTLQALGLPAPVSRDMARLMAATRSTQDDPMPPSRSGEPLLELTTADGALRTDLTEPRDPDGDDRSLLPSPDKTYLSAAATTDEDLAALAPVVPDELTRQVEALDPGLDADLRDWTDPDSTRPKVRVLGPVDVTATAGDREHVANVGGTTEFIIYLACREHGVTRERAADDLGWSVATVQNRARDVRRVLGQRPDGREWLPDAAKSEGAKRRGVATYELDPDVLVDADLFRRLRARASARGPDGLQDLVRGLSLVAGEPFAQLRRGGYGWLLEGDRLDHHMCGSISDVAHIVVTRALVEQDLDLARYACRIGVLVDPYSDVARLNLAALAEAEGRSPDDVVRQQIIDRVDEDLVERTEDVLKRRGWLAS